MFFELGSDEKRKRSLLSGGSGEGKAEKSDDAGAELLAEFVDPLTGYC